jgi:AcrR family transcriptional regulator
MSIRVARKRADTYQHGDLRRALIQAGLKLLSEGGVAALSLRAAAELAGVSHAAPYRHFRDKNALVAAIAEEGFRLLSAEMRAAIGACGSNDLLARLRAAGGGYVTFALRHPAHFRTIFSEVTCADDETEPEMRALRAAGEEAYAVLRDLVAEGIRRGRLRAGDPDQLSLAAWSLVHGLSMLTISGQLAGHGVDPADPVSVQPVTAALVHLLETGIKA